jgi:hypothetical protein
MDIPNGYSQQNQSSEGWMENPQDVLDPPSSTISAAAAAAEMSEAVSIGWSLGIAGISAVKT